MTAPLATDLVRVNQWQRRLALRCISAGLSGLFVAAAAFAAADSDPLPGPREAVLETAGQIELGRALYQGTRPFTAGDRVTAARTPAVMLACARCHGAGGEGRNEGGTIAPALRWSTLRQPVSGYADDAALAAALTRGIGRDGLPLDPAMPRFALEPDETRAIVAYLARLGTEDDRPKGIRDDVVTLGTALPLSGSGARIGSAVMEGLHEVFDAVNAAGGIHGRRVELLVRDVRPDPAAALQALHDAPVYALVAGLWRESSVDSEAMLAAWQLPHVASLVVRDRAPSANGWSLDLLAPLDQQQSQLADALAKCPHAEVVGISEGGVQPQRSSGPKVRWLDVGAARRQLSDPVGPGCIGYPLSLAVALRDAVPADWTQALVLPLPGGLLGGGAHGGANDGLWRSLGMHAGRLVIELLSRAGRALNERALLDGFDRQTDIELGDGQRATFSRTRRHAWDAQTVEWRAAQVKTLFGKAPTSATASSRP